MKFTNFADSSGEAEFADMEMNIDGLKYCPGFPVSEFGKSARSSSSWLSFWRATSWFELV